MTKKRIRAGLTDPAEFTRRGRRLPGQSSDEELGLERGLTIRVTGQAAVFDQEMALIGQISAGRYIQIGPTSIYMFSDGAQLEIKHEVDSGIVKSELQVVGTADDNDAYLALRALNYGGTVLVTLALDTDSDRCTIQAEETFIGESLRLTPITTTERNNLRTGYDGLIIYNSTTGKFQGRAAGSWVDLH